MKIKVVGLERSEGVSKKTNRPYTVGQVHAVVSLEQRSDASSMSKGAMGTTYRVDPEVIKRVEHLLDICRQIVRNGIFLAFAEPTKGEVASSAETRSKADSAAPSVPGHEPIVIAEPARSTPAPSTPLSSSSNSAPRVPRSSPWSFQVGG